MSRPAGPRQPPVDGRFPKGISGNPKGRPKGSKRKQPTSAFDVVIDKTLTVMQGGVQREVTVEEALQHQTYKDALAGSRLAQREIMKMIQKREQHLAAQGASRVPKAKRRMEPKDPDNADAAMLILGIASRDPTRQDLGHQREQLKLEPWAVQAALSRRQGGTRLTEKEMNEIKRCIRDPGSIRWPRMTPE